MTAATPRGSAAYFNEIFRNAVIRGKDLIDGATKVMTQSGYPPLTEPLTVRRLNTMDPQSAVQALRDELQRTTKLDPLTNMPIPDHKTIKLVTDYLNSQRALEE